MWWDRRIDAGMAFDREIQKALDDASCVLVVWTEASVESDWVLAEASEGLERGVLIPIVLNDVKPPLAFRRIQTVSRENLIEAVARQVLGAAAADLQHLLTAMFTETERDRAAVSRAQRIALTFRGQILAASPRSVTFAFPSATGAARAALEMRKVLRTDVCLSVHDSKSDADTDATSQLGRSVASIAEPGSISMTDGVFQQVRRRLELAPEDLGERLLDGSDTPIRVYRVGTMEVPRIAVRERSQKAAAPDEAPTLAVLPFRNMNGNPEFEYFGDGIAMDIVEELLRIPRMQVVSTMSTMTYKRTSAAARDIGHELGVRHILEGSVRQVARQLRITAQLINTLNGQVEWADHYDRGVDDIFSVQDEITRAITTAMDVKFYGGEGARVTHQLIRSSEARHFFYRAWELTNRLNKADSAQAKSFLEEAQRLEPESPLVYSMLAWVHYLEKERGWADSESQSLESIRRLVDEASRRGDLSGIGPMLTGYMSLLEHDHQAALRISKEAIEQRPSCPVAFSMRAGILNYSGLSHEAVEPATQAVRLSPVVQPVYPEMLALAHYLNQQHSDSLESANKTLSYAPDSVDTRVVLAAALEESGHHEIARDVGAEIISLDPGFGLNRYAATHPFQDKAALERIEKSLRKAGLKQDSGVVASHGLGPQSRRRVMPQRKR